MSEMTEAQKMWEEIKNLRINMYAIPNQTIEGHVTRFEGDPRVLYLRPKTSAVIVALEEVLAGHFDIEQTEANFICVTRTKKITPAPAAIEPKPAKDKK